MVHRSARGNGPVDAGGEFLASTVRGSTPDSFVAPFFSGTYALAVVLLNRNHMRSKSFQIAVVFLVALPTAALAQSTEPIQPGQPAPDQASRTLQLGLRSADVPPRFDLARDYETGKTMRNAGIVVTVVGGVAALASFIYSIDYLTAHMFDCGAYGDSCTKEQRDRIDSNATLGLVGMVAGAAVAGTGVTLTVLGARKMGRAKQMGFQPVGLTPVVSPIPGGVVAGVQLVTF